MKVSEGLLYGYGVFETIKVVDARPQYINDHFVRMQGSCKALDIALDLDITTFKNLIEQEISESVVKTFVLRASVIKDCDTSDLIFTHRAFIYTPDMYQQGFKLTLSEVRRDQASPLVYHKTLNYLDNLLELKRVKSLGFNEALFLNIDGNVAECATSNIFVVKDRKVYTPKIEDGILNGIMRDQVIALCQRLDIEVYEEHMTPAFLFDADEVFITNSVMEIMGVNEIQDTKYQSHLSSQLREKL